MNGFLKDNKVLSDREEKKRIPSSGNRMCQSCTQEGAHLLSLMISFTKFEQRVDEEKGQERKSRK